MLRKRQPAKRARRRDQSSQIATLTHDYPAGHVIRPHSHDRDQLVYAMQGVMTVVTGVGTWVVPTLRAVWIPATLSHSITMSGTVAMRTLYFRPRLAPGLPHECCVVNVPPLLRELILHACSFGSLNRRVARQRHLIDMIVDQLQTIPMVPLQLPHLSDPRARRVAETLLAEPGSTRTLAQLCKPGGASKRTVERLFRNEVGMTFGKWRQQLRLMHAVRFLAGGASVTQAALEAGYSTPSAFILRFRKLLGTTPAAYFRAVA